MANSGIKTLTVENWLQPDPVSALFVRLSHTEGRVTPMSGDDWASVFLQPRLRANVPHEVGKLFEVARGAIIYGYFFYPLYALAGEQLFRVAEAAVTNKCKALGAPRSCGTFQKKLGYLVNENVISKRIEPEWEAIRHLRNLASHPEQQTILPPGPIATMLKDIADKINGLFI